MTIKEGPEHSIPQSDVMICSQHLSESHNLLNLFERFSEGAMNRGLTFQRKDLKMFKMEVQIHNMITSKKFFHGPSRGYRPIVSVQEFLNHSDDEQGGEFEIQNEHNSLLNETWELPLEKEHFWTLWNRTVMVHKRQKHFVVLNYKHLIEILKDVFNQMGADRVRYHTVITEHLTALLTYQCISQREFS